MKKILVSILVTMMTLSLVSCGSSETSNNQNNETEIQDNTEMEVSEDSEEEEVQEPVELSDDLWSYDFLVNGKLYHIPMWFSELEELGWEYVAINGTILSLDPGRMTQDHAMWRIGENSIFTSFYNMGINVAPYTECGVVEIRISSDYLREGDWEIILPGGIEFGVSTKEDIIAAYGEPDDIRTKVDECRLTYGRSLKHNIELTLESEDGVLCGINIMNIEELEGADNTVSTEVPDVVKNYKAPESLGTSIEGTDIEINGKLYSLPCPVAEFVSNGFVMESEYSGKTVPSAESEFVDFTYNGEILSTRITNHSPNATTIENCFISKIEINEDMIEIDCSMAGGIKKGSTEAELLAILEGHEYVKDVISDTISTYRLEYYAGKEKSRQESYMIGVKNGLVSDFSVRTDIEPEY